MSIGVVDDDKCPIGGIQAETIDHLYFKFDFSRQCVEKLRQWLDFSLNIRNLQDLLRQSRTPRPKLRIIEAVMDNLIYVIWHARNEVVSHRKVTTIRSVVETIRTESKLRLNNL